MNIEVNAHSITIDRTTPINAGEYNITPCKFTFSSEYEGLTKEAIFSTENVVKKVAILNNECTIPGEILEESGQVSLGVIGYETQDDELVERYSPTRKYFNVIVGSYQEGDDPELPEPSEWERVLEQINTAITETNNLNIEAEKEATKTTIIITHKDGTEQEVEILDGEKGDKGDKGDPGSIKFIVVQTLPTENIDDTAIYLVPLEHPDMQGNNYEEWIYVNNQWELLGRIGVNVDLSDYYTKTETNNLLDTKQPLIDNDHKLPYSLISGTPDLTNYVKNTDYATSSIGGVVKISQNYGLRVNNDGVLIGYGVNYTDYQSALSQLVIDKATLENVIIGKDLTTKAYVDGLVGDVETLLETLDIGNGV